MILKYIIATSLTIITSYLLGSISTSIIATKFLNNKNDIRSMGSGNAGLTNVLRSVGILAAFFTLLGDFLKGIIAILIAKFIFSLPFLTNVHSFYILQFAAYLAGFFCLIGHIYPCFFKFKGGKGVLTLSAIVLITDYRVFILSISIFIIVLCISKIVSLSSICAVISYPIFTLFIGLFFHFYFKNNQNSFYFIYLTISTAYASLLALWIIFKHRLNIKRIKNGEEKKISIKKSTQT